MNQDSAPAEFPIEISVQEAQSILQGDDDVLLLDCRELDEVETAKIENSMHIPMGQITDRVQEVEPFRSKRIIVHCHLGMRSLRVTNWLRKQGFLKTQNMAGGIDAWSTEIDESVPRY